MPQGETKYKIVAVSLYLAELTDADRVVQQLRRAGWPHANRSLVMREALLGLFETLADKSDADVAEFFMARAQRRGKANGTKQGTS